MKPWSPVILGSSIVEKASLFAESVRYRKAVNEILGVALKFEVCNV